MFTAIDIVEVKEIIEEEMEAGLSEPLPEEAPVPDAIEEIQEELPPAPDVNETMLKRIGNTLTLFLTGFLSIAKPCLELSQQIPANPFSASAGKIHDPFHDVRRD